MTEERMPDNFDWVAKCHECSAAEQIKALRIEIHRDVKEAAAILGDGTLRSEDIDDGIAVTRHDPFRPTRVSIWSTYRNDIRVESLDSDGVTHMSVARSRLGATGRRLFSIDGGNADLTSVEFRRHFFEEFFFPPPEIGAESATPPVEGNPQPRPRYRASR